MSRGGLRAFAGGIMVSTVLMGTAYYLDEPETEGKAPAITEEAVGKYLRQKGMTAVPAEEYNDLKAKKEPARQTAPAAPKEQAQKEASAVYTLEIKPGMTSSDISKALQSAGIIKNAAEFNEYLQKRELAGHIQVGTYHVNKEMTFSELGKIITR